MTNRGPTWSTPALLRANDFDAFMRDRQPRMLNLIEAATGQKIARADQEEEGPDVESDDETMEARPTTSVAAWKLPR